VASSPDPFDLDRFVAAQENVFGHTLDELRAGAKRGHWMWFVFPQFAGLGHSETSRFYAIGSLDEARAYLDHALLGPRLRQNVEAILGWAGTRDARAIFGNVDAIKLRSSLTLFDCVSDESLFERALDAFFAGERDPSTLALLRRRGGL
jgi:uncharacterized protein (DUF1810 family)